MFSWVEPKLYFLVGINKSGCHWHLQHMYCSAGSGRSLIVIQKAGSILCMLCIEMRGTNILII